MNRLATLANHLAPSVPDGAVQASLGDSSGYLRRQTDLDDVVVCCALRTPMTKAKRGGLKDTTADDLVATVLQALVQQTGIHTADVGDIVFGSVLGPSSQRANEVRIGAFLAGFPETVPVHTVNRQCSSGLQAIASVAASIRSGYYPIGIAGGVETMSINGMTWEGGINPRIQSMTHTQSCLLPMGVTSENVAERFGVARKTQDAFAVRSHHKAAAAQREGRFDDEIVAVRTKVKDKEGNAEKQITVDRDDGIRPGSNAAGLARLPPAFKKNGTTTAGNSSQVTDGAAAVLLTTRREAIKRRWPVLGIFRSFAAVGVDPAVMGIGPAVAIPAAVEKAHLTIDDIDVFELNEAFASQATYCIKKLGLDESKVNVNGGAIALGHPLGMTGARCTATLLHEMKRRGKAARFGVVSMCIGSGMGAAAVFEAGDDALTNTEAMQRQSHLSRDAVA